jgi:excisionase family DNA binding protein
MSDDDLLANPHSEPFANQPDPQDQRTRDVGAMVGDWLSWSEAAEALGVSVSKVRQLIKEHHLAALVPEPGAGQKVPAAFIDGGEIVKGLPGRPIDALRENRGSEVKRRAQAMGF